MNEGNLKDTGVTYVLFGATGNLAQIKIMPALCALFERGLLPKSFKIITFSRRGLSDDGYREFIKPTLQKFEEKVVSDFLKLVTYTSGVFEDASSYEKLKTKIQSEKVFFHLAVLPESYNEIVKGLGNAQMRGILLVEKPFGHDSDSAVVLERSIEQFFPEQNIYRIDHYLAKLGVQTIIDKKINDTKFETKLNNENVLKVVCRFREVIDVSGRGEFYDNVGAFLDMGQSHELLVLATTLMNVEDNINLARQEIVESFMYVPRSFIRGQYEGYKEEKGVKANSETETYFRVGFTSASGRWGNVEIILEAGKALEKDERKEEVIIYYNDGSEFVFNIDLPKHYNAYERVIETALTGDKSVFVSIGEVSALWRCADEVRESIGLIPLINYKKGNGPYLTL